ncbi:hypothetical protein CIB93_09050 [Streptomyces sp. WZ.A104]|uniref:hypothetical protein n=1 Tax=Streptomyces sp. WZ.A104 TaxID=2023771 RepID=UPI000BBB825E|nr:hypothetical protein [Streptomyces sp. WZ.A104]PCG86369.1 hypothetical protein CIB93_09050 [Streptomyces sp. WZ.A104]
MAEHEALIFEYTIVGPDLQLIDGREIAAGIAADWTGTAHDLAREILKRWRTDPPAEHAEEHVMAVEVTGTNGTYAAVDDPTPVEPSVHALEVAIEAKLIADHVAEQAGKDLAEAMRNAHRAGLSKNRVADKAGRVMSRPTALKALKG